MKLSEMKLSKIFNRGLFSLVMVAVIAAAPASLWAQDATTGGIYIDPSGVLKLRTIDGGLEDSRIRAAQNDLSPELLKSSKMRLISLNRLEKAMLARADKKLAPSEEMRFLAGLTAIEYVFFYPETNEIVLAGPAEGFAADNLGRRVGIYSRKSTLMLDDLVAALRAYSPQGKRAAVISVSIDPTQEGLTNMQRFLQSVGGTVQPEDTAYIVQGLQKSLGMQEVTIHGVSPKTHLAQVLLEADYRMKLIGIGLERPAVKITSFVERASAGAISRNALVRWYFTPEYKTISVSEDGNAMRLTGQGVKLISASELVKRDGQRVSAVKVDPASRAFTESFTRQYTKLAAREPLFAQLKNVMDMSIVAAFIQEQGFYEKSNWSMNYLGNEDLYPIERLNTPKYVETAVNAVWKGSQLLTPVGGGVTVEPREALKKENLVEDSKGLLKKSQEKVTLDHLKDGQWWWDAK
ncbi:MAG: DUF1598 domain-containing protein [Pirellulaceae bacterium]|nr:DUF1598 domain-containing protein [Pirellulaceae bacterium]